MQVHTRQLKRIYNRVESCEGGHCRCKYDVIIAPKGKAATYKAPPYVFYVKKLYVTLRGLAWNEICLYATMV